MTQAQRTAGGVSIKHDELLYIATQSLFNHFFQVAREQSKLRFTEINRGNRPSLRKLKTNLGKQIEVMLALDSREFRGRINYSAFRMALARLLQEADIRLREKENLNVYTNPETDEQLFNIPGFVEQKGNLNAMLLVTENPRPGVLLLKLKFVDASNYARPADLKSD